MVNFSSPAGELSVGRAWERPAVESMEVAWPLGWAAWERLPVGSAGVSLVTASGDLNQGFDMVLHSLP